ncbi:MAG: NYN domain-containing protein [Thermoleophilia bacterium]|nr:NYN domain-containing protein [Thermoleophilia bacterium]
MLLHVIIDGRNVMRSRWPNVGERELVEAVARWSAAHARTPIVAVVFDGTYEGDGPGMYEHDERTVVVATKGEIADDVIAREVEELRAELEPVIVATSDRELRARVEAHGAKVIGGGSFLQTVIPDTQRS